MRWVVRSIILASLGAVFCFPIVDGRHLVRERWKQVQLVNENQAVKSVEPHKRSKRSLTALLAAEVLFLERILAAQQQKQNSRKPRKIVRPASVINNNKIEAVTVPRVKTKNKPTLPSITAPPVQIFKFGPPPPQATGTKFKSLPSLSVSSLDPFTMMKAPDLSKNSYGEYELYQTLKPASSSYSSSLSSSFQFEPEIVTEIQKSQSARQPKKRKLHYGAFELYQL